MAMQRTNATFIAAFGGGMAVDIGVHLNCGEADAIAAHLDELGAADEALAVLEGHADDDDAGDIHYAMTGTDLAVYLSQLAGDTPRFGLDGYVETWPALAYGQDWKRVGYAPCHVPHLAPPSGRHRRRSRLAPRRIGDGR